jgi:hypothetical protein
MKPFGEKLVYYLKVDSRESAKNLEKGKDVGFTREEF